MMKRTSRKNYQHCIASGVSGRHQCSILFRKQRGLSLKSTKALANEWASQGINVECNRSGYMATNNTKALRERSENGKKRLSDRIPQDAGERRRILKVRAVFSRIPCIGLRAGSRAGR